MSVSTSICLSVYNSHTKCSPSLWVTSSLDWMPVDVCYIMLLTCSFLSSGIIMSQASTTIAMTTTLVTILCSSMSSLLSTVTMAPLMQALVLSKLDYCNSLLLGMPKYLLHHLQKIQNMASRVINNHRKYDSVMEDMKNLHWLKIPEHIDYKVAVLIFQCINNQARTYLKALLNINHNRFLRSNSSMLLGS